ncbi:acyltransferase [Streptomyces sp. NPDC048612]|uniref:acyltransferase n=1 Tax=Streptomyces sp. NPDC048612 TaxID=3365579 RepID=UPI00371635C7
MTLAAALSRSRDRQDVVCAGRATGERVRMGVYDVLHGTLPVGCTFFYRGGLDTAAVRDSLGRTLACYPPLTGRMERDLDGGIVVVCNDAGASFAEAYSELPMPDYGIGRSAKSDLRKYLHKINPFKVVGHNTPLLTVKITHMRGGGSVLGVTFNHSVIDLSGFMDFLENWSREHHGLPYQAPPYARDPLDGLGTLAAGAARERSEQYVALSRREKFRFLWRVNAGARRVRHLTVRFPGDEVRAIKAAAAAPLAGTEQWVSTGDALAAHVWKVMGQLRARTDDRAERLGMVVDIRSALRDVLPDGLGGNAVTNVTATLSAGELASAPLADVASTVRAVIRDVTERRLCEEIAFLADQRRAGRSGRVLSRMALDSFDGTVSLNNVGRFPVYRIDLGSGRPFWFEYPPIPIPWNIFITPVPEDDEGRDMHLSIPQDKAEVFCTPSWEARLHAHAPRQAL